MSTLTNISIFNIETKLFSYYIYIYIYIYILYMYIEVAATTSLKSGCTGEEPGYRVGPDMWDDKVIWKCTTYFSRSGRGGEGKGRKGWMERERKERGWDGFDDKGREGREYDVRSPTEVVFFTDVITTIRYFQTSILTRNNLIDFWLSLNMLRNLARLTV